MVGRLMGLYFVHLFDDFVEYARIPRYAGLVGLCALSDVFRRWVSWRRKRATICSSQAL